MLPHEERVQKVIKMFNELKTQLAEMEDDQLEYSKTVEEEARGLAVELFAKDFDEFMKNAERLQTLLDELQRGLPLFAFLD